MTQEELRRWNEKQEQERQRREAERLQEQAEQQAQQAEQQAQQQAQQAEQQAAQATQAAQNTQPAQPPVYASADEKAQAQGMRRTVAEYSKGVDYKVLDKDEYHAKPGQSPAVADAINKAYKDGDVKVGQTTFGVAQEIKVNYKSIKDTKQAAFFAMALDENDRDKFVKQYAESIGREYDEVLGEMEGFVGDSMFAEPKSTAAKNRKLQSDNFAITNDFNSFGITNYDGTPVNFNTVNFNELIYHIKMNPDKQTRDELTDLLVKATKQKGNRFYGRSVDISDTKAFLETADFNNKKYENFVGSKLSGKFYAAPGNDEKNAKTYQEALNWIDSQADLSEYEKRYFKKAVDLEYKRQTRKEMSDDVLASAANVTDQQKSKDTGDGESGLFSRIADAVADSEFINAAKDFFFGSDEENAEEAEPSEPTTDAAPSPDAVAEEPEAEEKEERPTASATAAPTATPVHVAEAVPANAEVQGPAPKEPEKVVISPENSDAATRIFIEATAGDIPKPSNREVQGPERPQNAPQSQATKKSGSGMDSVAVFYDTIDKWIQKSAEAGESQGPVQPPRPVGTVDCSADPVHALPYIITGEADLLTDSSLDAFDVWVGKSAGRQAMSGVLTGENLKEFATVDENGNIIKEKNERNANAIYVDNYGILGEMSVYALRLTDPDFPKELLPDAVATLSAAVDSAEEGARKGLYDPNFVNIYTEHMEQNPSVKDALDSAFSYEAEIKEDLKEKERVSAAEEVKAKQERIDQAMAACRTGDATMEDWAIVNENAKKMTNAELLGDETYKQITQDFALDRTFSDAEEGGWFNDQATSYLSGKGINTEPGTVAFSQAKDALGAYLNGAAAQLTETAYALGYNGLGDYLEKTGFSEDVIREIALYNMRKDEKGITPEVVDKAHEMAAARYEGNGDEGFLTEAGQTVEGAVKGIRKSGYSWKAQQVEAISVMLASTNISADKYRARAIATDKYGYARAETKLGEELMAAAKEGFFPNEKMNAAIISYLSNGGNAFDLGILPEDFGWHSKEYRMNAAEAAKLQAWAQKTLTPGQGKVFEVSESTGINTINQMVSMGLNVAFPGAGLINSMVAYGAGPYIEGFERGIDKGYDIRKAGILGTADAFAIALANMATDSKRAGELKGVFDFVQLGAGNAPLNKSLAWYGGVSKAAALGMFETLGEEVFDELKEGVSKDVVGAATETLLEGGTVGEAVGAGARNLNIGKNLYETISNAPEIILHTLPLAIGAGGLAGFKTWRTYDAVNKAIKSGDLNDIVEAQKTCVEEIQEPDKAEQLKKATIEADQAVRAAEILADGKAGTDQMIKDATKAQEQADSHKEKLDASQAALDEASAQHMEASEAVASGVTDKETVQAAKDSAEAITKNKTGVSEHQREYDQKQGEADAKYQEACDTALAEAGRQQMEANVAQDAETEKAAPIPSPRSKGNIFQAPVWTKVKDENGNWVTVDDNDVASVVGEEAAKIAEMSDEEIDAEIAAIKEAESAPEATPEAEATTEEAVLDQKQGEGGDIISKAKERKKKVVAGVKTRMSRIFEQMNEASDANDEVAEGEANAKFEKAYEQLEALGEDAEAYTMELYAEPDARTQRETAIRQERDDIVLEETAIKAEEEDIAKRTKRNADDAEILNPVRTYIKNTPLLVTEAEAQEILNKTGAKSLSAVNAKLGTRFTTSQISKAMPIADFVQGIIDRSDGLVEVDPSNPVQSVMNVVDMVQENRNEQKKIKEDAAILENLKADVDARKRAIEAPVSNAQTATVEAAEFSTVGKKAKGGKGKTVKGKKGPSTKKSSATPAATATASSESAIAGSNSSGLRINALVDDNAAAVEQANDAETEIDAENEVANEAETEETSEPNRESEETKDPDKLKRNSGKNIAAKVKKTRKRIRSVAQTARNLARKIGEGWVGGTRLMGGVKNTRAYQIEGKRTGVLSETSTNDLQASFHELGHSIMERLGIESNNQMIENWAATFKNPDAYKGESRSREAFAEFFWQWMSDDAVGRLIAGDMYVDSLVASMKKAGIYKDVKRAQTELRTLLDSDTMDKLGAIIVDAGEDTSDRSLFEKIGDAIKKFMADMVDKNYIAEDVTNVIRENTGENKVDMKYDIAKQARWRDDALSRAASMLGGEIMLDGNNNAIGDSLKVFLAKAGIKGKDFADFVRYWVAVAALDRETPRKFKDSQGNWHTTQAHATINKDLIPLAELEEAIKREEAAHPEFVEGVKAIQSFNHNLMQAYMVDTGRMTAEQLDILEKMYPHYAPLNTVQIRPSKTFSLKKIVGSTNDKINPFDTYVQMVNNIVNQDADNRLKVSIAHAYDKFDAAVGEAGRGLGWFMREVTDDFVKKGKETSEDYAKKIYDAIASTDADGDAFNRIADVVGEIGSEVVGTGGKDIIRVQDGNKVRYFHVLDPDLMKMLSNNRNAAQAITMLAPVTRMMSKLTTSLNILFGIPNAIVDFQSSINYGSWARSYLDGSIKWAAALYEVWRGKSDAFKEYEAMGGGDATRLRSGNKRSNDEYRSEIFKGYEWGNANAVEKVLYIGKMPVKAITGFNELIEKTSRFAEYRYGKYDRKTAEGRMEAFLAAMDVTTDFGRGGSSAAAQVLKECIPFFNASLQAIYRSERQLTAAESDRSKVRFAKTVTNVALACGMANAFLLLNLSDEEKEDFYNLSDDLKSKNMFIPNFWPNVFGNESSLIRIPIQKSPVAYTINGIMTNVMWGKNRDNELALEWAAVAQTLVDGFWPIGSTIVDPLIAMKTNKNWYGGYIIPQYLLNYNDEKTAQYTEETPRLFVDAARWLYEVSNGELAMSPMMIQYVLQQYTGVIGQTVIPMISPNKITGKMNGLNALASVARKRLTTDPLVSNDVVSSVYDNFNKLTGIHKAVGDGKEIASLSPRLEDWEREMAADDAKYMTSKGGILYDAKSQISALYSEIDELSMRTDLDDEQKNTLIKQKRREMIDIAIEANSAMEEYREKYGMNDGFWKRFLGY